MNPDPAVQPDKLEVSVNDLVNLAVEHWRLSSWLATVGGNIGIARHAVRRMGDVLSRFQIEAQSLDQRPFDPGLAAKVIDTVDDPNAAKGTDTVIETLSPLVIWKGTVVRAAEIVVQRGTA